MGSPTKSEVLFERFCLARGLTLERIAECDEKRPDYRLLVGGIIIVVEIKEFDPNEGETEAEARLAKNGLVIGSAGKPGERIRRAISEANRQLKSIAKGVHPSLLVVYNNVDIFDHGNEYFVRVGMFGLETLVFEVPCDCYGSPRLVEKKFGIDKKITPLRNTTISAIGVLADERARSPEPPPLSVYHNPYAAVPLEVRLLRPVAGVEQFELTPSPSQEFSNWTRIDD